MLMLFLFDRYTYPWLHCSELCLISKNRYRWHTYASSFILIRERSRLWLLVLVCFDIFEDSFPVFLVSIKFDTSDWRLVAGVTSRCYLALIDEELPWAAQPVAAHYVAICVHMLAQWYFFLLLSLPVLRRWEDAIVQELLRFSLCRFNNRQCSSL